MTNGYVLGKIAKFLLMDDNMYFIKNLTPHAIEVIGIILAGSVSFYLFYYKFIIRKEYFCNDIIIFNAILCVYIIILLSAFLEVFVSFNL